MDFNFSDFGIFLASSVQDGASRPGENGFQRFLVKPLLQTKLKFSINCY